MALGSLLVVLVLGTVLGFAVCLLLRQWGIDPLPQSVKPAVEPEAKTEAPALATMVPAKKELELRQMIVDVSRQRAVLEQREKELAEKETRYEVKRAKLEELKKEMDEAQERVAKTTIEMESDEQRNMKKLAKIWAQMEPNEVANLVKGLDPEVVAKVIANMQERQAAPVLGALSTTPNSERMASEIVEKLKRIKQTQAPKKEIP